MLGMAFGSVYSGSAIKNGRRRALILVNLVGIIGVGITTVLNFSTFLIGRCMYGFCTGMVCSIVSKMFEETIPLHLYSKCSPANMIGVACGTLLAFSLSYILPSDNDLQALK